MRPIDADIIIQNLTGMKNYYDAIALDGMIKALQEAPTIEAYMKQIRWERDIALQQLEEIGCGLGRDMTDIKKALVVGRDRAAMERIVERLEECSEEEVMLWASDEDDYDQNGNLKVRKITDIHNYAIDVYQKAIAIVKEELGKE